MSRTIWKFQITLAEEFSLVMPAGAEIISVQGQLGNTCMWAIVDTEAPTERRDFVCVGTGHELPSGGALRPISTVQYRGGLVFHYLEKILWV